MTQEQKARAYDEALERASIWQKHLYDTNDKDYADELNYIFPELAESEDERMRKEIVRFIQMEVEDEIVGNKWLAWLEKQNKNNKPLYIRFGDIPKDEKSKVYNGEIEIGTEKGVSVYPAFEDLEGNIVLGLSLPITKTSLYTQQHLLEYDNRACYLVSGDYVGKGTDGEPLLRNIKIIREIKDFRVKQGEQETLCDKCRKEHPSHSCQDITELGRCSVEHEQKSDNSYCQENCKGEIEIPFGAKDSELQEATYFIPKGFHAEIDDDKVVIKKGEKPAAWSKEDERIRKLLIHLIKTVYNNTNYLTYAAHKGLIAWLEKQGQKGINLVELLKHYPKETELYSPLYGKLWLAEVDEKNEIITCYKHPLDKGCTRAILKQEDTISFYSNGTTGLPDFSISKDCMLFLYNIEKQDKQKSVDSYCQENCKGFQETGKCFTDGDCKAKREAERR